MRIILTLILFILSTASFALENSFYVLRSDSPTQIASTQSALNSIKAHNKAINILLAQAYSIDEQGLVWGAMDPVVLDYSQKQQIKIMPLVTNTHFDTERAHKFLTNPRAQEKAIQSILTLCKQNHYYGIQFDLEMIALSDRAALTHFYQHAADVLHQNQFAVSYAIGPQTSESPFPSEYEKRLFVNWEGAYDLKALSKSADFITLMGYNQHAYPTSPGPTADIRWVEAAIQYALKYIPSEKLSLGVPGHSTYWFTGKNEGGKIRLSYAGISYDKAHYLLQKYHGNLTWDDQAKANFAMYQHNWLYEYIFIEDAQSFKAKMDLVNKYHLRGIGLFSIGIEDPKIWDQI